MVIAKLPAEEQNLAGFREYIGESKRLALDAGTIDVTAVGDERGKITDYVLEDVNRSALTDDGSTDDARKTVPIGTITGAICNIRKNLR